MSLTNSQYNELMRTYDLKQLKAHNDSRIRLEEIYEKLPEYRRLDESIASLSVKTSKMLIKGEKTDLEDIYREIDSISDKKRRLLLEAGFPEDYTEPRFECSDCKDTGYLQSGLKCHCFKKQETAVLYRQSNLNNILSHDNFSNLSYDFYDGEDLNRFKAAVAKCRNFIENFSKDYENILFCGTVGVGKSFLTGCIAKELLDKGFSVIYFSSTELFTLLGDIMFNHGSFDELRAERNDLYQCDLLVIDDLGTELTNSATASQIFSILNERYLYKKATVISTNMSLAELQETYADRIFSRLMERYTFIRLTGPDIRKLKKQLP